MYFERIFNLIFLAHYSLTLNRSQLIYLMKTIFTLTSKYNSYEKRKSIVADNNYSLFKPVF